MKKTLVLLTIIISINAFSQDTIYFDNNWKACNETNAEYYRTIIKEKENFAISDFYANGNIQMKGYYLDKDAKIKNGNFKYFHPNGKTKQTVKYVKGKKEGNSIWYFKNGNIEAVEPFRNDIFDGEFLEYFENNQIAIKGSYINGQKTGEWKFWYEDGELAETKNYQINVEIDECKLRFSFKNHNWYQSENYEKNEMTIYIFKRDEISRKNNTTVIPAVSFIIEEVGDSTDVISYSLLKRMNMPFEVEKVLTKQNSDLSLNFGIGYIGTIKYDNGELHKVIVIHEVKNKKGTQIIMDITADLFDIYRDEFDYIVKSLKE